MKKIPVAVSVLLGGTLFLSGCQSASFDRFDEAAVSPGVEMAPDMGVTEQSMMDGSMMGERFDIITGDLYLTVEDTAATADQVTDIVEGAGGRIDSRSDFLDASTNSPASYLWVRIPADVVTETLDTITALGTVERISTSRMDVTLQVVDLDERIEVLNASLDRLEALLEQATTTAELIELETAITNRQAERDSLVSQQNYLSDQVQFASISIELRTSQDAPPREPDTFLGAITAGWAALVAFAASSVLFLGMSLPWLAVAAVILIPTLWITVRLVRKNRKTP
jgi:hypothetical protein